MNLPRLVRSVACALAFGAAAGAIQPAHAADAPRERLTVADPYLEVHTGPGRGYPVFHVVERADWVEIEMRHTDWFKIRTSDGKIGWVVRQQLERTLTEAGGQKTFRDVVVDDYLKRKVEMGIGYGRFKKEPMFKLWMGYRASDTFWIEGAVGQVQGAFSGTDLWHFNLNVEPWSDKRISPYFGVGMGKFKNIPNASLVSAIPTNVNLSNGTIGLRYYLTDRFVLRTEYTFYTAFLSDTRYGEYRSVNAGISFFF